jgi:hypothetical protein
LQTTSADCSGTIAAGETKTCTITNNDIAPDVAPITVPKLPNTGVPSAEEGIPWNIIILVGTLMIGLTSLIVATKKYTN